MTPPTKRRELRHSALRATSLDPSSTTGNLQGAKIFALPAEMLGPGDRRMDRRPLRSAGSWGSHPAIPRKTRSPRSSCSISVVETLPMRWPILDLGIVVILSTMM